MIFFIKPRRKISSLRVIWPYVGFSIKFLRYKFTIMFVEVSQGILANCRKFKYANANYIFQDNGTRKNMLRYLVRKTRNSCSQWRV